MAPPDDHLPDDHLPDGRRLRCGGTKCSSSYLSAPVVLLHTYLFIPLVVLVAVLVVLVAAVVLLVVRLIVS